MPLTDRNQAKEGGFAQVRESLQKFEGTVTKAGFDMWGGKLVDDEGRPVAPREFLEVACTDVQALEVLEDLSMDISELFTFRVNCSDFKGSFWVERFLESADKFKILIPDGLVGKRVTFQKVTLEAQDPKFNSTNFVIAGIKAADAPKVVTKVTPPTPAPAGEEPVEVTPEVAEAADPMEVALNLAVGKTETQFRTAIGLDPIFAGSPLLPLAKAGAITQALLNEGKLVLVDGKYQKPG